MLVGGTEHSGDEFFIAWEDGLVAQLLPHEEPTVIDLSGELQNTTVTSVTSFKRCEGAFSGSWG